MLLFFISRWFLQFQHVDPAEAVCIHEDLQSRHSLGIHWGTFPTGKEVCYSCTNGHVTCISNSPGNFFVGCPAWFSKPCSYFRPKNVICHIHFQTWPVKSVPVFRPGGGQKLYTFSGQNGTKTHTYVAYMRENPSTPPPPLRP